MGVELAGEIKTEMPEKEVTLIHSNNLLCHADGLSDEFSAKILKKLEEMKVNVLLNERTILEEVVG